ncbi:hypothetical protein [Kitasatospora sp. NPDC057198]|uniref:hypothetical protein n=1 Tax=Kitasatospora sp. NPDC057198 TaxID=3346046 RepID=UPI003634E142
MSTAQNELLHAIVAKLPAHTEAEALGLQDAVDAAFPLDEPPAEAPAADETPEV